MAGNVRAIMIEGAARLLAERGLEGTSFAGVLDATGAPRGSVYHHFPGGKNELVAEAVRHAGNLLVTSLEGVDTDDPVKVIAAFTGLWRRLLTSSGLDAGCAVAAVATGAPRDEDLRSVTAEVFERWTGVLAEHLQRAGLTRKAARGLATTAIAAVEGALVVARATHDLRTFDAVATQLRTLAEAMRPA